MASDNPTTRFRWRTSPSKTGAAPWLPNRAMIVAAAGIVVLAAAAIVTEHSTRESLDTIITDTLQTALDAETTALDIWLTGELKEVSSWARSEDVRQAVVALTSRTKVNADWKQALLESKELDDLRHSMQPIKDEVSKISYGVTDRSGLFVAGEVDEIIGTRLSANGMAMLGKIIEHEGYVVRPHRVEHIFELPPSDSIPYLMLTAAPIRNDQDQVVGVLWFRLDPLNEFVKILKVARIGETGETYAFDRNGLLLSKSRFDKQLEVIGLLNAGEQSVLKVHLRDPGGDMTRGYRPTTPLDQRPLTRMAAAAVTGQSGIDLDGYRDYRGVKVLGAWTWLEKYDIGIATEIDAESAWSILRPIRRASWGLITLLGAAFIFVVFNHMRIQWLSKRIDEIKQLGQYTLEEKIGEGGMGMVYRASHALLRRPTAIKLLKHDQISAETVARFEREVQITSELTHPNTIEIYDFGRTGKGVFYYAMEYLDGVSMARMIEVAGPLPPGRVIHLLRQTCGSLAEAHGIGLIHRDIKPLNIMVCERGGLADVVKVLDFGLVKDIAGSEETLTTMPNVIPGTPMYTPPERLKDPTQVDARTDIYALGAVAFNLLTGRDVFQGRSAMDICQQVIHAPAPHPQECIEHELPAQLDQLVFKCLSKIPDERPADMAAMITVLDAIARDYPWTDSDAKQWWSEYRDRLKDAAVKAGPATPAASKTKTMPMPSGQ